MYTTRIETEKIVKGLATIKMDDDCKDVVVYVRETIDASITSEVGIKMHAQKFIDLVHPIIDTIHQRTAPGEEVV